MVTIVMVIKVDGDEMVDDELEYLLLCPLNDGNCGDGDVVDDDDGVKELRHLLLKPLNQLLRFWRLLTRHLFFSFV